MRQRRGQTLMEIAVSLCLLAMLLIFTLNLIPQGYMTLRKSHQLDVATSLAIYRLDETTFMKTLPTGIDVNIPIVLYDATYQLTREFYVVDSTHTDVVVTVSSADLTPVHFPYRIVRTP